MATATLDRPPRRRLLRTASALAVSIGTLGVLASPATAAPKPLPTPSPVTVSEVTAQSFKLGIGTSASKLYSVYLDGRLLIAVAASTQTSMVPVNGLTQNTTYTVQVEEVVPSQGFRTSPRTAPLAVRTLAYVAPTLPASPTNLQATNVTADSVQLSWNAVRGGGELPRLCQRCPAAWTDHVDIVPGRPIRRVPQQHPQPGPQAGTHKPTGGRCRELGR